MVRTVYNSIHSPHLSHILPLRSRRLGRYQITLLGDRGTCVWTPCPGLLRGCGTAGSRTCDLAITSLTRYRQTTKPHIVFVYRAAIISGVSSSLTKSRFLVFLHYAVNWKWTDISGRVSEWHCHRQSINWAVNNRCIATTAWHYNLRLVQADVMNICHIYEWIL